jgi:hypothetical protein
MSQISTTSYQKDTNRSFENTTHHPELLLDALCHISVGCNAHLSTAKSIEDDGRKSRRWKISMGLGVINCAGACASKIHNLARQNPSLTRTSDKSPEISTECFGSVSFGAKFCRLSEYKVLVLLKRRCCLFAIPSVNHG